MWSSRYEILFPIGVWVYLCSIYGYKLVAGAMGFKAKSAGDSANIRSTMYGLSSQKAHRLPWWCFARGGFFCASGAESHMGRIELVEHIVCQGAQIVPRLCVGKEPGVVVAFSSQLTP